MIRLAVWEYCHDCPEFEPDVDKLEVQKGYYMTRRTNVYCKHQERCLGIVNYLREELRKNE